MSGLCSAHRHHDPECPQCRAWGMKPPSRDYKGPRLIGLAGQAGVGKTTIAEWFRVKQGFKRIAYADPLKQGLAALTGLDMMHFTNIDYKEKTIEGLGLSPRQLMQMMGTDFVRDMVSEDFWVWRMEKRLQGSKTYRIIVDDCRFENETQLIRDLGGQVIHLDRDYEPVTDHVTHRSERELSIKIGDLLTNGTGIEAEEYFENIWSQLCVS